MLLLASNLEQLQYLVQAGPNAGTITPLSPRVQEEKTETQRQKRTQRLRLPREPQEEEQAEDHRATARHRDPQKNPKACRL